MSRFANLISRALEREQKEQKDQPETTPLSSAAEINSARANTAKKSKSNLTANQTAVTAPGDEQPDGAAVSPEDWRWSEPPPFARRELAAKNGSKTSTETGVEKIEITMSQLFGGQQVSSETAVASPSQLAPQPKFRSVEINPENVEPHLIAISDSRSPHCEEFRNLRTHILHAAQRQSLQAFVVASGSPSEGKSTVALNLAWLLAQTDGIKALIIDSDLRLPCLADYLGVAAKPGLSEVFSGEAKLEDAIVRLEPAGLHLLPGGAPRENVAEILSGNKFREILIQARKIFDYIIVDAPSLGTFTDASVLINQTDAALLVVRAGKTRYGLTDRLLETLPRERILGVVLNSSDEGLSNQEHYDSYYYQNRRRVELAE